MTTNRKIKILSYDDLLSQDVADKGHEPEDTEGLLQEPEQADSDRDEADPAEAGHEVRYDHNEQEIAARVSGAMARVAPGLRRAHLGEVIGVEADRKQHPGRPDTLHITHIIEMCPDGWADYHFGKPAR